MVQRICLQGGASTHFAAHAKDLKNENE